MRTFMKLVFKDNVVMGKALRDGTMQKLMQGFAQEHKPEASYFLTENGNRCGLFVFDLKDSSQIPSIAEPFFTHLNATVEFHPVMNQEDLGKGLEAWSRKAY